jgi:hypothetical protein
METLTHRRVLWMRLQAYLDNVPEKMAEAEFWTRYCRAQYYLKVRKGTGAQGNDSLTQSRRLGWLLKE